MRNFGLLLLAGLSMASTSIPARCAVLIPVVAPPGASKTAVYGINNNNLISGSFVASNDGVEHAFFGTLAGAYTVFDGGSGGSQARAINDNGYITGFSNSQHGHGITGTQPIFERLPSGKILNVNMSGQQLFGRAQGINNSENRFAGTYWSFQDFDAVAFVGRHGKYEKDVSLPGNQASDGEGINDAGVIVGQIFQPPLHGFIRDGRTVTIVDYPDPQVDGTGLEGINDTGEAVGQWTDQRSHVHSFLLDIASQTFTDIEIPGARNTEAWNINNDGAVAVSSNVGSFIWCARKRRCPAGGMFVAAEKHKGKGFVHYHCDKTCAVELSQ
jgi:uncharacterized membrane protein